MFAALVVIVQNWVQIWLLFSSRLWSDFTKSEIEYVALHETGHFVLEHPLKEFLAAVGLVLIGWLLIYKNPDWTSGFVAFWGFIFGLLLIQLGKKHEYEADRFAASKLEDTRSMISATAKFEAFYSRPPSIFQWLFYRGVPYVERVKIARESN